MTNRNRHTRTVHQATLAGKLWPVVLLFLSFFFSIQEISSQVIWSEDFNSYANGTTNPGNGKWSIDASTAYAGGYCRVQSGQIRARWSAHGLMDTAYYKWTSQSIDISSSPYVQIDLTVGSVNGPPAMLNIADTIRGTYQIDGGPEIQFFQYFDDISGSPVSVNFSGISGSSLVIHIYCRSYSFTPTPLAAWYHYFDNVTVSAYSLTTLYSRSGTFDWSDVNAWSYTPSGGSCGCIPDKNTRVYIQSASTIYIYSLSEVKDIYTYGRLRLRSNLGLYNGGGIYVYSGGSFTGMANCFVGIYGPGKFYFSNTGTNNAFSFFGLGFQSLGANLELIGSGRIQIPSSDSIGGGITINANDNELINKNTASFRFRGLNCSNLRFLLDNYTRIYHYGRIYGVGAYALSLYNRENAYYDYSGAPTYSDTTDLRNMVLYARYQGNQFLYTGALQYVIPTPIDAYYDLSIAGSMIKALIGDTKINHNLNITSTLDATTNNYAIQIKGDWNNNYVFVERNGLVNFNGSGPQAINISGDTAFYNLTINNTGSGVTLNKNITVTNNLTMTQGNFLTGSNVLALTNSAAASLVYASGTIIGNFRRSIAAVSGSNYDFPVGTASYLNTFRFTANVVPVAGTLTASFNSSDPGSTGLPLAAESIYQQYPEGYWTVTSGGGFNSTNYSVSLTANGFTSYTIDANTRLITRPAGGSWALIGTHAAASSPYVNRNNLNSAITTTGLQFGLGHYGVISTPTVWFSSPDIEQCDNGSSVTLSLGFSGPSPWTVVIQRDGANDFSFANIAASPFNFNTDVSGTYSIKSVTGGGTAGTVIGSPVNVTINPIPTSVLGYAYRKQFVVDHNQVPGATDLRDFPVLIKLTGNNDIKDTINSGNVCNTNGYDIIFTDANYNRLYHQIESYDPVLGTLVAWVRVPVLYNATATTINMLYGNPEISASQQSENIWSEDFVGVWHLNNNDLTDATSNTHDGTNSGSTDYSASIIAGGRSFDGVNDKITIPRASDMELTGNITLTTWFRRNGVQDQYAKILWYGVNAPDPYGPYGFEFNDNNDDLVQYHCGNGSVYTNTQVSTNLGDNTWYFLSGTYNNPNSYSYLNGVLSTSNTITGPLSQYDVTNGLVMASRNEDASQCFTGYLDEVRLLRVSRSADWLLAEYNNQSNPTEGGFFSSISAQQSLCPVDDTVCQYEPVPYNVPDISGFSYNWQVTGGTVDGSGHSVNIIWDTPGTGTLALEVINDATSCSEISEVFNVEVITASAPTITGNDTVCPSASGETYSVVEVSGHSYVWDVSGGVSFSGQGTFEIAVDWGSIGSDTIVVTETNDATGCSNSDTLFIEIEDDIDPIITCPPEVNVNVDPGVCVATGVSLGSPITSDDCSVASTVNDAPASYSIDTTIVTWTVFDVAGNAASCQQLVIVTDDEAPSITCPADINQTADAGVCQAAVTIGAPVTSDNCGVATTINDYNSTADATDTYPVGTTTVIWTVTDIHGNTNTCSQDVTITDDEAPSITCPADINQTADAGVCQAAVTIGAPVTSDNCGVATTINDYNSTADATDTYPVGTTTVIWTVTDIHGNTNTCSEDVTITDDEAPVIIDCITDITVNNALGKCGATVNIPTSTSFFDVTDNCGIDTVYWRRDDGIDTNYFDVGTSLVWLFVEDFGGNKDSCSFNVTVNDVENPVARCKNISILIDDITGTVTISPFDLDNSSSDNCGIDTIMMDQSTTFDCSNIGVNIVDMIVVDIHGNRDTCQSNVTVGYELPPVFTITPVLDTVCNGESTNIVMSGNIPTTFSWTVSAPVDIIGASGNSGDTLYNITQNLTNLGDTARLVTYTIIPTIYGTCALTPVTAQVWVEPTSDVSLFVPDTLVCNYDSAIGGSNIIFDVRAVAISHTGMQFIVESVPGSGLIIGNTPYGIGNIPASGHEWIEESVYNNSSIVQTITYYITPFIVINDTCFGSTNSVTFYIEPTPTVNSSVLPPVDTICNHSYTNTQISTSTSTLYGVKFQYSTFADANVTGYSTGLTVVDGYIIDDSLSVSNNNFGRVEYTIIPYVLKPDSSLGCAGISSRAIVWVEPTPKVSLQNLDDTICSGDPTSIWITSPTNSLHELRFKYQSFALNAGSVIGTLSRTDLEEYDTIQDPLVNITDTAQLVRFVVTPYYIDQLGNEKCIDPTQDKTIDVWVEPTPRVDASPELDTICNNSRTSISFASNSAPANAGKLRFRYTVLTPSGVQVFSGSMTNLDKNFVITDSIHNSTDTFKIVQFIVEPYISNTRNCYNGITDTVLVYVEPTPKITATPVNDTVCNDEHLNIVLSSSTVPTREIRFRYTIQEITDSLNITSDSTWNLGLGYVINDSIHNNANYYRHVKYVIEPYIREASGDGIKCTGGTPINVNIWIEPTPLVNASIVDDTLCNNSRVSINLKSITHPTRPVKFRYTVLTPSGVFVTSGQTWDLPYNFTITDSISNTRDTSQLVQFIIEPYTMQATGNAVKCTNGISDTINVWIEPTPKVDASPELDTICNDSRVSISISSVTKATRNVRFAVAIYNVNPSEVLIDNDGTPALLDTNFVIIDSIHNYTDTAKLVTYIIIPYIIDSPSGSIICYGGIPDTVAVWVEPTPRVILIPVTKHDTICNRSYTEIRITSPTYPTSGIEFRYTSVADNPALVIGEVINSNGWIKEDIITDSLVNLDTNPQKVTFTVTPYLLDQFGNEKGCNALSDNFEVMVLPDITILLTAKQYNSGHNIRCFGNLDGEITATVNGGYVAFNYPTYTQENCGYLWNNGMTSRIITNLGAGSYIVTVTDKFSCSATDTIELIQPDLLQTSITITDTIKCEGGYNGGLRAEHIGGAAGFLFEFDWDGPDGFTSNDQEIDSLRAGYYNVLVTDTNLCFQESNLILPDATPIAVTPAPSIYGSVITKYNIQCFGGSNGFIYVKGDSAYKTTLDFDWSGPLGPIADTTDRIDSLVAGDYMLVVTDAITCTRSFPITLVEPAPLTITDTIDIKLSGFNISCHGGDDGSIKITSMGGNINYPYYYQWIATNGQDISAQENDSDLIDLRAGTYELTVGNLVMTDSVICPLTQSFVLTEPDSIEIQSHFKRYPAYDTAGFGVSCKGVHDGEISIDSISGGFTFIPDNYQILWSTGATTETISNLTGNLNYSVTVTDDLGCWVSTSHFLPEPNKLLINYSLPPTINGYHMKCYGDTDGYIDLSPTGGHSPSYEYYWYSSDGEGLVQSVEDQSNLSAGVYNVTVNDANGCTDSKVITLRQPSDSIVLNLETHDVSCNFEQLGSAAIIPQGGVFPYDIYWTGPSLNDSAVNEVTDLMPGDYQVTLIDLNTCTNITPFTIVQTEVLVIDLLPLVQYNGQVISCYGSTDGTINVTIEDGRPPYQYDWSNMATTSSLENIGAGRYDVTITDESGCQGISGIDIDQPEPLIADIHLENALCFGSNDGYIDILDVSGGVPGYIFTWQDTLGLESRENLAVGDYFLTITDLNSCLLDTMLTVYQPDQILATFIPEAPYCPDLHDGALEVSVTGGIPAMVYQWSTGDISERVENLNQDLYSLTVTDANNCILDTSFYLIADHDNCLQIPNAFSPNNDGHNDIWEITIKSESGTDNIPLFEIYPSSVVIILDRWGNMVYKSANGYVNPWNGNYMNSGNTLPVDSYHYIIELNKGKKLQGTVTIVK